jgi:Family of unknown function (DUF6340)
LEGVLTGEAIGQDRRSREEAVQGLTSALTRTPRFQVVSTGIEMSGSKAGNNLPAPLEWSEVERICRDYGTDAIATIESFDSDNSASTRRVENKRKDKNGKEYIDVSFNGRQRTGVRIGWRMYDPKRKIIIDEYTTDDFLERTSTGSTERAALNNLPSQVNVTRDVAYNVGLEYGARIAPIFVQLNRNYYHKAKGVKSEMKQASRFFKSKNEGDAVAIWKKIEANTTNSKKTRGRAAFNMAVASEVEGNLEMAMVWARKSYDEYGNKKARHYIIALKGRQNDVRKVESQMPGKKV